jgi:hypothetical protein
MIFNLDIITLFKYTLFLVYIYFHNKDFINEIVKDLFVAVKIISNPRFRKDFKDYCHNPVNFNNSFRQVVADMNELIAIYWYQ